MRIAAGILAGCIIAPLIGGIGLLLIAMASYSDSVWNVLPGLLFIALAVANLWAATAVMEKPTAAIAVLIGVGVLVTILMLSATVPDFTYYPNRTTANERIVDELLCGVPMFVDIVAAGLIWISLAPTESLPPSDA